MVSRVLDPEPLDDLDSYLDGGGGRGLEAARKLGTSGILDDLEASGLRGRGGAGFPTGAKWRTVAANVSPAEPATIVVNGAEGEPGSFKDRAILRRNPYRVLEGALVAAAALSADRVVVALKAGFDREHARLRAAAEEIRAAGWCDGVAIDVVQGPTEYLYGEETALLEVLAGRAPFPRLAPPYRHGADEVTDDSAATADVDLAGPDAETLAPPTLVNNVETMANVALIMAESPTWFREHGTDASPGTIVCTVTGTTERHGVVEVPAGTPLREVIELAAVGPAGERITAVLSGVSHPILPASGLDTPLTHEAMTAAGSGLGATGFIVFDETVHPVAIAQGVSRFLAVESCGQCVPCKQDGLAIAEHLTRLCGEDGADLDVVAIEDRAASVIVGARCYLAQQHQNVATSLLRLFPDEVKERTAEVDPLDAVLIAPIVDLDGDRAVLDDRQRAKQPDWTYGDEDSGQSPADRVDQHLGER
jgi:NADH:ubiquinone oxidoreductase subunit F (NADH-binding)